MAQYTDESVLEAVTHLNKLHEQRLKLLSDFIKAAFNIRIPLIFGAKDALLQLFAISLSANLVYTAAEIYDFCQRELKEGNWITNIYNITDLSVLEHKELPYVMDMFVELRKELADIEQRGEEDQFYFCNFFLKNILPKYGLSHPKSNGVSNKYNLLCLALLQGEDITSLHLKTYLRRNEV